MNFLNLYNKVFLKEAEAGEQDTASKVAMPEDFDDVKPAPVPTAAAPAEQVPVENKNNQKESSNNLKDYVVKLEDFANLLNNVEEDCLQSMLSRLDVPGTPLEGITKRVSNEVTDAAKTLRSICEKLKEYIIDLAKA